MKPHCKLQQYITSQLWIENLKNCNNDYHQLQLFSDGRLTEGSSINLEMQNVEVN